MHVIELSTQPELTSFNWDDHLSPKQKLKILRTLFGGSLDNVDFWDLYRVIKKNRSQ